MNLVIVITFLLGYVAGSIITHWQYRGVLRDATAKLQAERANIQR